jgi:hypothetical protein
MKPEAACHRQWSRRTILAAAPKKIPVAVKTCQLIRSRPRLLGGRTSLSKIGTIEAFAPIPIPRRNRVANNSLQVVLYADPITEEKLKRPAVKRAPRLPNKVLIERIRYVRADYASREIGDCIDRAEDPDVAVVRVVQVDIQAELSRPAKVRASNGLLVPSLRQCPEATCQHGDQEVFRHSPKWHASLSLDRALFYLTQVLERI